MRGCHGGADFLFEIGNGAQGEGRAEDRLRDFLDAALAKALSAGEIRQRRRQPRPDAVGPNHRGDRRLRHGATARAGAGMGLIFGNLHGDRRQLDGLKTLRLRVAGPRRVRQRGLAVRASVGHEMLRARDALGRQQLFQMRRMLGLAAAAAFGFLLFDGLVRAQGVGGRRRRGVGGVGLQTRFQLGQPSFQVRDACVAFTATRALRGVHAAML